MVIVLRLIAFAYNIRDGAVSESLKVRCIGVISVLLERHSCLLLRRVPR